MKAKDFWTPERIAELRRRWGEDSTVLGQALGTTSLAVRLKARAIGLPALGRGRQANVSKRHLLAVRKTPRP